MEIVNVLTQQLGINTQQASGGLGLLMSTAKQKLGGNFGQIASVMPGVENLIDQAPQQAATTSESSGGLGSAMGGLGGLLGKAGASLGGLGSMASVVGGFKQLGLGPDMIGKFVSVVLGFVQNKGGDRSRALLEGALR